LVLVNGQRVTRGAGLAIVRIGDHFTVDEVMLAEKKGDLSLLGARTSVGLNLNVRARRL